MRNETKGIGKGLLIGTLAGAAIGSIIALMYAPKSGKNLRDDIKTKSHDFLDDVDEYIVKAKDKISHLMNVGKNKSDKLVAETKEKVDMLLNEAEKLLSEAKDKTGKVVHQGKEKYEKENERLKSAIKAGTDI